MPRGLCAAAVTLILGIFAGTLEAQELAPEVVDTVRGAVAFVRVKKGAGGTNGTAFLVRRTPKAAYLLTTSRTVGLNMEVELVFSPGTPAEKIVTARVVRTEKGRDLATLAVEPWADMPQSLEVVKKTELNEAQAVFLAGYPFGDALASAGPNPAITITQVSVASLRRGSDGELSYIQISADVNSGHNGAALLDARGHVVGVLLGKLVPTGVPVVLAPEAIQDFFRGDAYLARFKTVSASGTRAKIEFEVELVDPLEQLSSVSVRFSSSDMLKPGPRKVGNAAEGSYPDAYPEGRLQALSIKDGVGKGTLDVTTKAPIGREIDMVMQIQIGSGSGKPFWGPPFSPKPLAAAASSSEWPFALKNQTSARFNLEALREPWRPAGGAEAAATEVPVPESLALAERLDLATCVGGLAMTPDGQVLFALDATESRILRIDAGKMTILKEAKVPDRSVSLALSPDGKGLYVLSLQPVKDKDGVVGKSRVQQIGCDDLAVKKEITLDMETWGLAVSDAGILALGTLGYYDVRRDKRLSLRSLGPGVALVALSADQRTVFGVSPTGQGDLWITSVQENPSNADTAHHAGAQCLIAGNIAVSANGRWIATASGALFSATDKSGDPVFAGKFPPSLSVAFAPDSALLFAGAADGRIRALTLPALEAARTWDTRLSCFRLIVNGPKKRLHAFATNASLISEKYSGGLGGSVGDLISWSLEGK